MLVGGGKLILTKGDAKFTEAQVHGPDDGVLLLSKGAEAFDDRSIVEAAALTGAKVFMKDSLKDVWGPELIREHPEGMVWPEG